MVPQEPVLVMLVKLVDRIPEPPQACRRGRPRTYSDRLFLKALIIMVVRHLPKVHTFLEVLEQETPEAHRLRTLLTENGRFPARRTWERRLRTVPEHRRPASGTWGAAWSSGWPPGATADGRELVTTRRGPYLHADGGVEVRRIFHALRSKAIENFNGQFKAIFDCGGQVPTRGLLATRRYVLGAVFVYQLTLLHRHEHGGDLRVGLKPFLKAA
jgi:hypothetical protein